MEEFKIVQIKDIQKNPYQPRKEFSEEKIQELAQSIKENGLIQPIIVRRSPVLGYEILAGERRYRASIVAGLSEVPVIVKQLSDQDMMLHSIIENLQRENLNPIEEAKAYQSLIDKGFTHTEIAEKMGKSRPYITNLVRLLGLPKHILTEVESGKLSQAHARLLIQLSSDKQDKLLNRIQTENLSVRQVEQILQKTKKNSKKEKDYFVKEEEQTLKKILGLEVHIKLQKKDSGKITISFHNQDEYQQFINSLK
ncbi:MULTISPECIES: ParB/RepB/Spo0J family partition protein [unclassified Streptococcus]|uniref:ParB/RepB/Spo0J family partition protein n=1 Tax=Streptococcus fermentans TaxID=3095082 RepID=A0ABU5FXD0_9STRE|nr:MULTISPECIES: ParB/RepB/Spo0J family partition protein [unclassified Streptococcus]MDY4346086.1 ParB/RepB/Spo0J family partition protein [Streptococcus sp. BJSWXB5TM5]MDY4361071.1 ParB/RepB/Spo0J family partition protein [Streptococcus sp. BJSWXB3CM3]MDY4371228.1 ParB/RepB/Spo0J family partition protein [Streptococcus sp. BJSWXB6CM1]